MTMYSARRAYVVLGAALGLTLSAGPWAALPTPPAAADAAADAVRLADLPARPFTGHRGAGAYLAPENTEQAFAAGVADPAADMLEFDVQVLADGAGAIFHDLTVDRITTSSGRVADLDSAAFKALTIDARSWFGGTAANTRPLLLDEFLDEFAGRKALLAHPKDTAATRLVISEITRRGLGDQVRIQTFSRSDAVLAKNAGMQAQVLVGGTTQATTDTPAAIKADGLKYVSLWQGLPDATIRSYVAAGLTVSCYDVDRQYRRDQLYRLGVAGIDGNDPVYSRGATAAYRRTGDPFATMKYWYGHMSQTQNAANVSAAHRGSFTAPGWWSIPRGTSPLFVRQGWAVPPDPKNYVLHAWIRYDALGSDATRWAGVYFSGRYDHAFNDAANARNSGYTAILRQNGSLELYRKSPTATVLLKKVATPALKAGTIAKISIRVTATTVYARRYDVNGASVAATDGTYRGAYIYLGRAAAATAQGPGVSFDNVAFS
ncbi:MAG TPA: glycerophosphodiester phosphodiesterase family protein [Streptosporangiaceae bacterium]|jgi:glycerophosphoryl diester phosphodiesterase|nr:glycerophosphodiester phosphodiesterase family protein [Streptosporangiaceae bacterium]